MQTMKKEYELKTNENRKQMKEGGLHKSMHDGGGASGPRYCIPCPQKDLMYEENLMATKQEVELPIKGETAVIGIGFKRIDEFVAAGVLTRRGKKFVFKQHTWICANSADLPRIKFPYMEAVEAGDAEIIDAPEIPPDLIVDWVARQKGFYNIQMLALDDFRFALMKKALAQVGFTYENKNIKLVRPSDKTKIEPVIDSAFRSHNIVYGDCPIMRWYTNNEKGQGKEGRTEGFWAFVAAMTRSEMIQEQQAGGKGLRERAEEFAIEIMENPSRTQQEAAILPQLLEVLLGNGR